MTLHRRAQPGDNVYKVMYVVPKFLVYILSFFLISLIVDSLWLQFDGFTLFNKSFHTLHSHFSHFMHVILQCVNYNKNIAYDTLCIHSYCTSWPCVPISMELWCSVFAIKAFCSFCCRIQSWSWSCIWGIFYAVCNNLFHHRVIFTIL